MLKCSRGRPPNPPPPPPWQGDTPSRALPHFGAFGVRNTKKSWLRPWLRNGLTSHFSFSYISFKSLVSKDHIHRITYRKPLSYWGSFLPQTFNLYESKSLLDVTSICSSTCWTHVRHTDLADNYIENIFFFFFKQGTRHHILHLKLSNFGTDPITNRMCQGQRESNLEGLAKKTVRVFFLSKFFTLQLGGSIGIQHKSVTRTDEITVRWFISEHILQNTTKLVCKVITTINEHCYFRPYMCWKRLELNWSTRLLDNASCRRVFFF